MVLYGAPGHSYGLGICPECDKALTASGWPKHPETGVEFCDVRRGAAWDICEVHPGTGNARAWLGLDTEVTR